MNNVQLFNRVVRGELSASAAAHRMIRHDRRRRGPKAPAWLPRWMAGAGMVLLSALLSVVGLKPHS